MKAHQISISDHEHWGDKWALPEQYLIEATAFEWAGMNDAPVVIHLYDTAPERAAHLLREVANALDRNGRRWLPELEESEHAAQNMQNALGEQRDDIGESEKRRHALRVARELEEEAAEIRCRFSVSDEVAF